MAGGAARLKTAGAGARRPETSEDPDDMHFKLIVALVDDTHTEPILHATREDRKSVV